MPKILIVGAGQAGLQLALGLLTTGGYEVTVMSQRTAHEIRTGFPMSTQCMFGAALAMERAATGVDFWAPAQSGHRIDGLGVSVAGGPDEDPAIDWLGNLSTYAQSVDQRVKMSRWLELVQEFGGSVVYHGATDSDLDRFTTLYDLVIVAAGKGDIVNLFDRDNDRSPFTAPMRSLAVSYVDGVSPRAGDMQVNPVRLNLVPGLGELFVIPALSHNGPCAILFWEGVPQGPIDTFESIREDPRAVLSHTLELIREHAPWEYERCAPARLTDPRATLVGRYAPIVRNPIAVMPSGRPVLGMADVVVALDPITGQGSNNAARAADTYLKAILENGDRPFDEQFMRAAGEAYWNRVAVCAAWTNNMLLPPPDHVLRILGAAGYNQLIADRFANSFSEPSDLASWFATPDLADAYLAEAATGTSSTSRS